MSEKVSEEVTENVPEKWPNKLSQTAILDAIFRNFGGIVNSEFGRGEFWMQFWMQF